MLVLSRQKNESIVIGDDIQICVVEIRGDKIRLGINAPQSVPVHRMEVYQAIRRQAVRDGLDAKQALRERLLADSQVTNVLDRSAEASSVEANPNA